eukprot:PITA_20201
MSFYDLRLKYALEGSSNYIAWKDRMEVVLEDNRLKEFIDHNISKPLTSDAKDMEEWIKSDRRKLALKEKLRKIKMEKGDSIPKYLTKFTQCWDELGSIGVTIAEDNLVSLTILGLPKSWHNYQDLVNGGEKLPEWERLWSDLVQEEIRQNTRDGSSSKNDEEENCALAGKAKKGQRKSSHSKSDSSQGSKKKDVSKIKCFHCQEMGHYDIKCPHKKVGKNPLGGVAGEALASQFELDFTRIACMVSSVMGSVWHLDSGASFHMSNNKELFSNLEEKDL